MPAGPLALTVAPSIVGEDSKRPRKSRRDAIPAVVVSPGAVDKHYRITTLTDQFPIQGDPVNRFSRHTDVFRKECYPA